MARPKNTTESVQITISTTATIKDALEALAATGFYGKNAADTAHMILSQRILELSRDPLPTIAPWAPSST